MNAVPQLTKADLSEATADALAYVIDLHDDKAVCDALHGAGLSLHAVKYLNLVELVERERRRRAIERKEA